MRSFLEKRVRHSFTQWHRHDVSTDRPLKTVCTVRKYDPIGTTIIARVNPSSLKITSLRQSEKRNRVGLNQCAAQRRHWEGRAAHLGTAGAMFDFSSTSSFSRKVFSVEIMRRVAIMLGAMR